VIPLRDRNPTRSTPIVTYLLIAMNVAVFAFQLSLSPHAETAFVSRFGLVPFALEQRHYVTLFSSMFLHGGFLHLIFNMWSLAIFGDNVEDRLGKLRYVLFYLGSGLCAALAQYVVDPHSGVPMVGASGAIAGVLAAYLKLFPRARIVTLIPLLFFFFVREIPASFFILFWFLLQVLSGVGSLGASSSGGVAVFAHIGGFLAGLWLVRALLRKRNETAGFRRPTQSHSYNEV
jgi:membrane associated rhomboid family serine protease